MTQEKWNAMTAEEREKWRTRKDTITAVILSIVTTIVLHLIRHLSGW